MEILNWLSWTVGAFVLVLGIMIFVHELGHHLMAKYLGIGVEVFSLGFGPRLIGFSHGGTDYRVSLLPLGGYVKMKGENYDEQLEGSLEEFLSRPKRQRFAVAVAGPVMNLGLAVTLLAASYVIGIRVPAYLSEVPVIGHVEESSPAAEAGIQIGDRILQIDGVDMNTWEAVQLEVMTSPGQLLAVKLDRDGREIEKLVRTTELERNGAGFIGVSPTLTTVISAVEDGPAKQSGLQSGDAILRVESDSVAAEEVKDILALIASSEGVTLRFTVRRDGEILSREVTPARLDGQVKVGIGIASVPGFETRVERYGLLSSVKKSFQRNYELTLLTFEIVGKLIQGKTSLRTMSGPIEIAKFSGQAASQGVFALLAFMAMVSLQLGIFNLFPIPILDGGVIALLAIEGLIGRDLSLRVKERIFQVGFIFLVLLMGIVIFNDIAKNI